MSYFARTMRCHQGRYPYEERANLSSNIHQNLQVSHFHGKELMMEKIKSISSIHHVNVRDTVESNVHVFLMGLAVKNIVGMS